MRIFADTSALFKKYLEEKGSDEFAEILDSATDIAVSPTTRIETHTILARRVRNRELTLDQANSIRLEIRKDFASFRHIRWTESLVEKACELTGKLELKSMDSIQLAAAVLSIADGFVTADQKLFIEAKKIMKPVFLV